MRLYSFLGAFCGLAASAYGIAWLLVEHTGAAAIACSLALLALLAFVITEPAK